MRLTQKKIEEIIVNILGHEGLTLLKQLYGKEHVSEFDLASRTKMDIKVVRRLLYVLYNNNLVGFIRKKDKEKGWYIYYWTLLHESLKFIYFKKKREALVLLQQQLEQEKKELFFVCVHRCVRLNFDQATDFEFHCPECGELISHDSSATRIPELVAQIKALNAELEEEKEEQKQASKSAQSRRKVVKPKVKKRVQQIKLKVKKVKPRKR